jgi:hypothetical protein
VTAHEALRHDGEQHAGNSHRTVSYLSGVRKGITGLLRRSFNDNLNRSGPKIAVGEVEQATDVADNVTKMIKRHFPVNGIVCAE